MAKPIFTSNSTRTWIQTDGVGTPFELYTCHGLTTWSRDYDDTVFVKCKSPDEYGKKVIVETIPGDKNEPTFTVLAYTNRELDFLLGVECPVDFQVFYGACSTPSDPQGYTKIRHFYQASKSSESEENIDFIGDEDPQGIQISTEWTAEDVVTIVKTSVASQAGGCTETQGLNDIAFLDATRCEGECGKAVNAGDWGVAVAPASYGVATANVWVTADGGASFTIAATDPFSDSSANISSCVILSGETAPRIIVGRGNVSTSYGARFSISDDWGATWTEVDGGGAAGAVYINSMFKYSDGLVWAVGNGGRVFYSQDRGASWTMETSATTGTSQELWDIDSPDGDTYYAVGDNNTVIRSTDGGLSWGAITGPAAAATIELWTCSVDSKYRVMVGGNIDGSSNCLWVTNDAGGTWDDIDFTGSTTATGAVRRIRAAKPAVKQHKIMIHGASTATARYGAGTNFYFHRTLDGGATWTRMNLVTNSGLNGLAVIDVNEAWACGQPVAGVAVIQKMYY